MIQKVENIAAVHPVAKPVNSEVRVPGSKSFTNRALVIAALAEGTTAIHGASDSNDSSVMIELLEQLGVGIEVNGENIKVKGIGGKFKSFKGELDVEDAGTVMRFMTALCCLVPGEIVLKGSERMHQRPIKELVDGLKQLGADISYMRVEGYPPLKIKGGTIRGGKVTVSGSISSQFVSAMLMISPLLEKDTEINIKDEQVSEPYIDMTINAMQEFGVKVEKKGNLYTVNADQSYEATTYNVEGDASSASYLFAIAAVTNGKVMVTNISKNSLQSDAHFVDILGLMGCKVTETDSYIEVIGTGKLNAVNVNMQDMPDIAQTLAVVAAFAKGETIITGLKTLQLKESKRITALQTELAKMGIECEAGNDFIKIRGGNPKGAFINTYNDHRMAMSFAVAGARVEGVIIESPEVVKKSFPTFWTTLQSMGIKVDTE